MKPDLGTPNGDVGTSACRVPLPPPALQEQCRNNVMTSAQTQILFMVTYFENTGYHDTFTEIRYFEYACCTCCCTPLITRTHLTHTHLPMHIQRLGNHAALHALMPRDKLTEKRQRNSRAPDAAPPNLASSNRSEIAPGIDHTQTVVANRLSKIHLVL